MILSAYERKGYAKLFGPEEMVRSNVRPSHTGYIPGKTINQPAQTVALQPQPQVNEERLFRFAKRSIGRGVRFGLRRVLPRLAPVIGWGLLAKDIYDIVTD